MAGVRGSGGETLKKKNYEKQVVECASQGWRVFLAHDLLY